MAPVSLLRARTSQTNYRPGMSKRGIIIGGGLVVLLGMGCLGLTTVGGIGAWLAMSTSDGLGGEERVYSQYGDHSGPAVDAVPIVADEPQIVAEDVDTEADSELDSEADAVEEVVTEAVVATSAPRVRRRPQSSPSRTAPEPFSAPGELPSPPVVEEENLDDIDLERTAIEVIDEELTPRERRRLRRREGRN